MGIVAIWNEKGGVGRTTLALNLLAAIARAGQRPLGIDLDPRGQLSEIFGLQPPLADASVCAFFAGTRSLADIAQITKSGVALCPAHPALAKVDALAGKGAAALHRLAKALRPPGAEAAAGHVVIDCGPFAGTLTMNAIFACDALVVPISADLLALRSAVGVERRLYALERVLKRRVPRRYVLTRYDAGRPTCVDVAARTAMSFRPDEVCATRVRESASLAESAAENLDVFRHAPDSNGARDVQALADELVRAGFLD